MTTVTVKQKADNKLKAVSLSNRTEQKIIVYISIKLIPNFSAYSLIYISIIKLNCQYRLDTIENYVLYTNILNIIHNIRSFVKC